MGNALKVSSNQDYSLVDALTAAELSKFSYHSGRVLREELTNSGWSLLEEVTAKGHPQMYFENTPNAFAYTATQTLTDGTVRFAIAFRGTDDINDWIYNNAGQWGFLEYYKSVRSVFVDLIHSALQAKAAGKTVEVLITGHSLGGAAAIAAFADLELTLPGLWTDPTAPLGGDDRLFQQPALAGYSYTEIRQVADLASVYTFGAPSLLTDPDKPTITENQIAQFLVERIKGNATDKLDDYAHSLGLPTPDFTLSDVKFLSDHYPGFVFTVDTATDLYDNYQKYGLSQTAAQFIFDAALGQIPNLKALTAILASLSVVWAAARLAIANTVEQQDSYFYDSTAFKEQVFQFEHDDSSLFSLGDPVAQIGGAADPGSQLAIDLLAAVHERYDQLADSPVALHSIDAYLESIARLISSASLMQDLAKVALNSPLPSEIPPGQRHARWRHRTRHFAWWCKR